jgi:hypothetical protein
MDDSFELNFSSKDFNMDFTMSSNIFYKWNKEEDFALFQLPKTGFSMFRIPISLSVRQTQKKRDFVYIGRTEEFNISPGVVCFLKPHGFTMSLLSAPGYSGAAILSDGLGRAIGYLGGNLDASTEKNSQHQAYAFRFDDVVRSTRRKESPSSSPGGKVVDRSSSSNL